MNEKLLGKINSAEIVSEYGHVYFQVEFGGDGWGVGNAYPIQPGPEAKEPEKWSIYQLGPLLKAAKVEKLSQLKDKPVEVTFENNTLKDWRILTEVL